MTGDTVACVTTLQVLLTVAHAGIHTALINADVRCGTMLLKPVMADMEIQLADNISTVHRRVQ